MPCPPRAVRLPGVPRAARNPAPGMGTAECAGASSDPKPASSHIQTPAPAILGSTAQPIKGTP